METKECGFSGFKMNGFLALFLHLVVLTAVIIFDFTSVPTASPFGVSVPGMVHYVCRLYGAGAERGVLWCSLAIQGNIQRDRFFLRKPIP